MTEVQDKQAAAAPSQTAAEAHQAANHRWHEHVPRTTAVLAVLAAVASGSYAGQFSKTILAQAEASDQWAYYQSKSIKKHLSQNMVDTLHAMGELQGLEAVKPGEAVPAAGAVPEAKAEVLRKFEKKAQEAIAKYDKETKDIEDLARMTDERKKHHQKQGDRFQIAFVVLQAGVVLSTIAASARRRELWMAALLAGVAGLVVVADAFFLFV
jgi:Domain of unknown function (DUF4337)